ncbi:MAG: tetratricopeptide repeat protein [Opitutales bacterium]|nr:tetratricopeptide repeat protein [Opitutales bacterium]
MMKGTAIVVVWVWLWAAVAVCAAVPLDEPGAPDAEAAAEERGRIYWDLESARAALRQGFPGMARRFFEAALAADLPEEAREEMQLPYASALIALGAFAEAGDVLDSYPRQDEPAWLLRRAFTTLYEDDADGARELLSRFPPTDLGADDRAWYFLLEALLLAQSGDGSGASSRFEQASQLAVSPTLRTQFEVLRLRAEMEAGTSASVSELRATERSMRGQRGGFEAARLLAIALHSEGRTSDAVEVLDRQLRSPSLAETGLRPSFLLLMGMISGEDTGRGRLALRQLFVADADRAQRETALYLLAHGPLADGSRPEFDTFLTDLLENHPEHPLRDQVLVLRALRRASAGSFEGAEADATLLLEEFPGSPLVRHAHRLLAYLNWSREPPRYRTAADYLNRLRAEMEPGAARARLGILMGDCYFKNRDYAAASDVYAEVFRGLPAEERSALVLPWVVADIRSGRFDRARATLDEAAAAGGLEAAARWRAEWNLIDAMRRAGRSDEALARAEALVGGAETDMPSDLAVRFRWLEARLALDAGQTERAVALADGLLAYLEGSDERVREVVPGGGREGLPLVVEAEPVPVASHVLLLKGEAYYAEGDTEAGNMVFEDLRERYPASGPAILSFLISARDFGAGDSLGAAQQTLRQLADEYRESEYAPIALWETAIYAERRGTNSALRDAVTTLEDLIQRYPGHPLVFYARLKQADISRKLNDFGSALMLYERMLRAYPDHPERYRVEMGRGDCLLARGSVDEGSLEDAALVYERIVDLPSAPYDARVEAGVKLAVALRLLGRTDEAGRALWTVRTRFDPSLNADVRLERQGRYWLARALLELAAEAEEEGNVGGAQRLYTAILEGGLPGRATARSRLERFE